MQTRMRFRSVKSTVLRNVLISGLCLAVIIFVASITPASFMLQPAQAAEAIQNTTATAKQLQMDGTRLQLQGNVEGAIKKYRESLALESNEKLEILLKKLEKQIGKTGETIAGASATQEKIAEPTEQKQGPVALPQEQSPAPSTGMTEQQIQQTQQGTPAAPEGADKISAPVAKELAPPAEARPTAVQTDEKNEQAAAKPPVALEPAPAAPSREQSPVLETNVSEKQADQVQRAATNAAVATGPQVQNPSPSGLGIGDKVKFDDSEWEVVTAREVGSALKGKFDQPKRTDGKFVYVQFKVLNTTSEQQMVLFTPAIQDSTGRKFEELNDTELYLGEGETGMTLEQLPSGLPKKFSAIFEVPSDASGFMFLTRSFAAFRSEEKGVKLGF